MGNVSDDTKLNSISLVVRGMLDNYVDDISSSKRANANYMARVLDTLANRCIHNKVSNKIRALYSPDVTTVLDPITDAVITEWLCDVKNYRLDPLLARRVVLAQYAYIILIGTSINPVTTEAKAFNLFRRSLLSIYRVKYNDNDVIDIISDQIDVLVSMDVEASNVEYVFKESAEDVLRAATMHYPTLIPKIKSVLGLFVVGRRHLPVHFNNSIDYGILKQWCYVNISVGDITHG